MTAITRQEAVAIMCMEADVHYVGYDAEHDEITIADDHGLLLLGPGEGPEVLEINPESGLVSIRL